jgi:phosphoribosylamine--glycine ligase
MKKLKVMVIGSGAREHALAWKINQSLHAGEVICCPGNGGIAREFRCAAPKGNGIQGFLDTAIEEKVDFTVVGPEAPLVEGIVDLFMENGLKIFGPQKAAAIMTEGSKIACRRLLQRAQVPGPDFFVPENWGQARNYIKGKPGPFVIKADGLAAGKGVALVQSQHEALAVIDELMLNKKLGPAGETIVIEECLVGRECSFIVITAGSHAVPLIQAQDYKRLSDGDMGPMTGGMGSFAPAPLEGGMIGYILNTIVYPTLKQLSLEGQIYQGAMYFGLMLTQEGPRVLEINCRFGDPETQVQLPLLDKSVDFLELLYKATLPNGLANYQIKWSNQSAVGVVLSSKGYPGMPETGKLITGLDEAESLDGLVFCAGMKEGPAVGQLVTSGGRVATVVWTAAKQYLAREMAYLTSKLIDFEGKQLRQDIGKE